jgi:hypothetical protein
MQLAAVPHGGERAPPMPFMEGLDGNGCGQRRIHRVFAIAERGNARLDGERLRGADDVPRAEGSFLRRET